MTRLPPVVGPAAPEPPDARLAALDRAYARGDVRALGRAARELLPRASTAPARPDAAHSALLAHAARLLALLGAPGEGLTYLQAARDLLPQSAVLASNVVHYLLAAGRVDEAEAEAARIADDPTPSAEVPSLGALVARATTRTLLGHAGARADADEGLARAVAAVRRPAAMRGVLDEVERGVTPRSALGHLLTHAQGVVAIERRAPPWAGEPCAGRAFLVLASGGLGDQIQSFRTARAVADAGGHVTLICDPALHGLVLAAGAAHAVVDGRASTADPAALPPGPFDFSVALTLDPAAGRPVDRTRGGDYLRPGPATAALAGAGEVGRPTDHIAERGAGRRVGIVWAGNAAHPQDRARSMPAAMLTRLVAATPAVEWVSLQVGPRAAELRASPVPRRVRDAGAGLRSMLDTAHRMLELDLLVSVDSAPAHLAGALGVPVWTLLGPLADWRWELRRADTPLYPSMRLVRDASAGDWTAAADRVAADLAAAATEARPIHSAS